MFPESEDFRFFKAIEAEFIRLRITPLQLSPDDFQIARAWRAAGAPLELVLEVLCEKVAAQREKGQEVKRRLSYYRKAVLSAWEKRQELLAPGARPAAPVVEVEAELEELAAALPPGLAEVAAAIRGLAGDPAAGDPAAIEAALEGLEARAFDLLREGLSPAEREGLEGEVAAALRDLRQRLPADQLERVAASLERQLLRQNARLPAFSLFAK
jgi:hypothetical protein